MAKTTIRTERATKFQAHVNSADLAAARGKGVLSQKTYENPHR